ncbi:MlaD family protein [Amycolatopsis sp.]|uniref:MlaD family protein n=1 Tax=Amycolatopsis sp. TaxID=37632 RepID=UPI002C1276C6|nr:MlaD family protein [Amycolatopsis sp.]HVV08324.1 MlaD family protein [Amycolatopsis sp.]
MNIPHAALPKIRLVILTIFVLLCALIFGYLWVSSGGRLPLVSKDGYRVSLDIPKVSNLVDNSDVTMAGVTVGKVAAISVTGNTAHVTMQLDSNAPLHEGATVQVREKTLVDETFLEITEGKGAVLPDGATLPAGSAKPAVELNDVLVSLDAGTRNALGSSLRSLGVATDGSRQDISQALTGLGELGRNGKTALDALAAQSDDLRHLTGSAATLLAALDTRQGEIADLVDNANQLAAATADNGASLQAVMRKLPGVLDTARGATSSVSQLSAALTPVAADLRAAGPDLNTALEQLPKAVAGLRGILPALDAVLGKAPATLDRVPPAASDLTALFPSLQNDLLQLNPMLTYLEPYGQDIAHLFVNWGASLNTGNQQGQALRLLPVLNRQAVTGVPLNTNIGPLNERNPYPAPGAVNPVPFTGQYPQVQQDPAPR